MSPKRARSSVPSKPAVKHLATATASTAAATTPTAPPPSGRPCPETIDIRGAREHNLREVNLSLPKNALIVFTGVSGSGKSSLAFDTLYAEGQRRYIESLSSYARQFLGQLAKPDCDHLSGLAPAISIDQKTGAANPRSTVGTITEIHDYLRVLFARVGQGHCPQCNRPIAAQSRQQIVERLLVQPGEQEVLLLAPVARNQKGEFKDFFADMLRRGFVRARVDGQMVRLADKLQLDRQMRHNIEIVVDRLKLVATNRARLADSVEQALKLSEGSLIAVFAEADSPNARMAVAAGETGESSPPRHDWEDRLLAGSFAEENEEEQSDAETAAEAALSPSSFQAPPASGAREELYSAHYACQNCQLSFEAPTPQLFSFNSPQGMCPGCDGLGQQQSFDPDLLVPDPSLSIKAGALVTVGPFKEVGRWRRHLYEGVAKAFAFSLEEPWQNLSAQARAAVLYGSGKQRLTFTWRSRGRVHRHADVWEGVIPDLLAKYRKTSSPMHRAWYEKYMRIQQCPACNGSRLKAQARFVRVAGKTLLELEAMPTDRLAAFCATAILPVLTPVEQLIATPLLRQISQRLGFLLNVGLHYLSLDRSATTLSGGEAQRIRLAGQIGSGLVGVLYVLDEPSIGLHPRDNAKLIATLQQLRDQGNTVLVVEHDEETMRAADVLVDFGPGPGVRGGEVVAQGTLAEVAQAPRSLTGQYLSGKRSIAIPQRRPITPRGSHQPFPQEMEPAPAEPATALNIAEQAPSPKGKATRTKPAQKTKAISKAKQAEQAAKAADAKARGIPPEEVPGKKRAKKGRGEPT